jgi:hypothetical protein
MRGLNEIIPIQDTFCTGIGAIERLDGNMLRLWLYVSQAAEEGQVADKLVVAKIVAPASAIPDAVLQLVASISEKAASLIPLVSDMMN